MRRWGLTATFAAVSVLAMVVVGAVLVVSIASQVRDYALTQSVATAKAYLGAGVESVAPLAALTGRNRLDQGARDHLDALVDSPNDPLLAIRLWTLDSQLIYGTDLPEGGFPDGLRLDVARSGGPAPRVVTEFDRNGKAQAQVLSVYLPVTRVDGTPVGVAEVVLDYSATQRAVAGAVRLVAVLVAAGLALLWLLLFRTVSNASRRLRGHATENARLALLDPLTGLPNRRLLATRIDRAIVDADATGQQLALLLLDVDGFKEINDTLGHDIGDKLLVEVAQRVRAVAREGDTVARLGGDEFAVLMPVVAATTDATTAAQRVLDAFAEPFDLGGWSLNVESSIGVAILPDHADDQMMLMRCADVAMYAAKRAKIGVAVYASERDHHSAQRLTLLGDLRQALATDDQLALHYQPKIDLATGRVAGFEALLRWTHPEFGPVSPAEFVALAEQTGLITDLTAWVLREAVDQLRRWERGRSKIPLDLAVNFSARNLHEPELAERVRQVLDDGRVSAGCLEIEVTESAIPADVGRAQAALMQLAEQGVRIAVDDFGVGNTSINQLRNFPLRTIKIDRTFIASIATEAESRVLVRAIIDLAHEFDLITVAEGVEDEATADILRELKCDLAQGFLWSPAVPANRLSAVVRRLDQRTVDHVASS